MSKPKIFADGFTFKRPKENAPDWVIGHVALNAEKAVAFIQSHTKNGWVNLNINRSQSGKDYIELDTFEPKKQNANAQQKVNIDY